MELLITLAIFAIIATMAAPSMTAFFDKKRVIEAAEELYANMQLARSEAIARSRPIHMRFNTANSGATWQYGISQNQTCDLTKTDVTEVDANACVLVVDDGSNGIDDGQANVDANDLMLHRYTNSDFTNITMSLTTAPTGNEISFDPTRGTAESATITLQSEDGFVLRLKVGVLGQIRLCSPSGATHINGYDSNGCTA